MRAVVLIARKDLLQRLRDRTALILAVLAPAALAAILSLALGGTDDLEIELVVATEDDGAIASTFVAGLLGLDGVTVERVGSRDEAVRAIEEERATGGVVIPAGFSAGATSGAAVEVEVLRDADAPVTSAVATAVANALADRVTTGQLAATTALALGADPETAGTAAARAVAQPSPVAIDGGTEASISGATAAYFGAAMVILFLYFTVQFGPRSLLDERETHALQRLLAAPIARATILGGKAVGSLALGISSMAVVIVLTSVLLGAHYGDPSGVALLSAATVLAVTAVVSLVTVSARTREQADGYASGVAIVFALIGGNFIDLTSAPAALRAVAKLTPNGWALQGYDELSRGQPLEAVVPEVAVLLGIATVIGAVGALRARRLVST